MMGESAKKQNVNTIGMFDLSRGMLMLLVIIGHSVTLFYKYWEGGGEPSLWMAPLAIGKIFIYGLIPMFFMMSGYGFRKQKMGKCIKARIQYLLKPYVWVMIVVTLLAVLKKILQHESIVEALRYQTVPFLLGLCPGETGVLGCYVASIGPLWFLVVLGVAWIGLNLIFQLESEAMQIVCIITLAAFSTRLPFYAFMPFCFVQSLCCIAYLYIGYYIKKNKLMMEKLSKKTLAILVLILVCVAPFGNVEVSQNVWKLGFLDFVASCVAGFLLFKIFIACNRFEGRIANSLRVLGSDSLYILCVHTVEYLVFPWERVAEKFEGHMILGIVAVTVVRILFILAGCFLIKKVNKIIKYRR